MPRVVEAGEQATSEAADRLRAGGVVGFPTETVYGLGGDAFNADAIERIFQLKGRPLDNPLIVHVLDAAMAERVVSAWDERAATLADRFWPGPLTLVLPRSSALPSSVTAGLETVAVRAPAHPAARRLIEVFGGPIAAPSANRSGHVSPTRAEHVASDFVDAGDLLILDGGASEVGIESTVLALEPGAAARVLRPGSITADDVRQVIGGEVATPNITSQEASPGTALRHYAPRKRTELAAPEDVKARLTSCPGGASVLCFEVDSTTMKPHESIVMPRDAAQYAAALYGALREADASANTTLILIEQPPRGDAIWDAVHDRLRRAASET